MLCTMCDVKWAVISYKIVHSSPLHCMVRVGGLLYLYARNLPGSDDECTSFVVRH